MNITQINKEIYIDGEKVIGATSGFFGSSVIVQNGKNVYVNGAKYNLQTKKFKRTFASFFACLFA